MDVRSCVLRFLPHFCLFLYSRPIPFLLGQSWRNYGTREDFLGTRHSLLSHFFSISLTRLASVYFEEYVYNTDISDCVETVFELPLLPSNMILQWNIFTQIGSGAQCWLDIYHWVADLAVTGRIHVTGRKVSQSSFQTESSSSSSYCHIIFLIAFLEKDFIRNIVIILWISYIIIIYI